jgi:type II secretory pathway pseudopilin PulG
MTPDSYASSTPTEITPQIVMNWWASNWQWALPVIIIIAVIVLAITALMIVSTWKIFKKAGKPGWAAIIPFYSTFVMVEVIQRPAWMFWTYLGLSLTSYLPMIGYLTGIGVFIFSIIWALDLAKVFGQSAGFGVANIFFPLVTYPILAFDKNIKYVGSDHKKSASKRKTHTGLIVALVILIPAVLIVMGILAAIIVGVAATNSKGSAMNGCRIAYAKNIESAADYEKNNNKKYPLTISNIDSALLDKSIYQPCVNDVIYTSDGQTYTVSTKLEGSTNSDPTNSEVNIKDGVYSVTK